MMTSTFHETTIIPDIPEPSFDIFNPINLLNTIFGGNNLPSSMPFGMDMLSEMQFGMPMISISIIEMPSINVSYSNINEKSKLTEFHEKLRLTY